MERRASTHRFQSGLRALAIGCLLAFAVPAGTACASDAPGGARAVDGARVPSLDVAQAALTPGYWISRLHRPDRVLVDADGIRQLNARLLRFDTSLHDLSDIPPTLQRAQVADWIANVSRPPTTPRFDASGAPISAGTMNAIVANADVPSIAETTQTRFGIATRRAALRTFPTTLRVFSAPGDNDLDRFQESALFPGTPVVIAHESRDRQWWFVVSPTYAAWVEKSAIAEGSRMQVLGYGRGPSRVVTGARASTATSPEAPAVSDLTLDMGVRLPLDPSASGVVNGQAALGSWPVSMPMRSAGGDLEFQPALIPRSADTSEAPLPLTRANIIRQAFKFLGERYGWGDDGGTRDCSGFVSVVFASMGVTLPRNTGDQARSPALDRVHLDSATTAAQRMAAIERLQVGDLVYIPGHVMLVVGRIGNEPYVIHDIHDGKALDQDGQLHSLHFNGVVVTPLNPLRLDASTRFVDAVTDIVRIASGAR